MKKFYSSKLRDNFASKVTDKLYMRTDFVDSIWNQIFYSELRPTTDYKYSDLGFYMMSALVKEVSGKPIDQFVQEEIYQPLGLQTATYNPLNKFSRTRIPPTEEDKVLQAPTGARLCT